jgi:hypothetical protein
MAVCVVTGRWQHIIIRLERCFRRLEWARAKAKLAYPRMVLPGKLTFQDIEQPWRIPRLYPRSFNLAEGPGEQRTKKHRDLFKLGVAAGGANVFTPRRARASQVERRRYNFRTRWGTRSFIRTGSSKLTAEGHPASSSTLLTGFCASVCLTPLPKPESCSRPLSSLAVGRSA